MKMLKSLSFSLISLSVFAACAGRVPMKDSPTEAPPATVRIVEKQVRAAPPAGDSLAAAREAVFESPYLDADQKKRMKDLYAEAGQERDRLNREIAKNKLLLTKQLVNPNSKDEDIELLKNHILELERDRTSNFMSTLDRAESILGRRDSHDERFYRAFLTDMNQPEILP